MFISLSIGRHSVLCRSVRHQDRVPSPVVALDLVRLLWGCEVAGDGNPIEGGATVSTVVLVHGGLWEEMTGDWFWKTPGIVSGLRREGFVVFAPDRLRRAVSWGDEVEHLVARLPAGPVTVVAGSNGCSVAVRLALAVPRVEKLVLAWPATASDPVVDARVRAGMVVRGAAECEIRALLAGRTLRGVTDDELGALTVPVGVVPSVSDNPFHQRRTVDALLEGLPCGEELPGCPEPSRPDFPGYLEGFVASVAKFVRG
ncbi:alpha/beta hydrolase [Actinokineospora enzanensis]|uniref:alpha/beta hydrolase n=1 Tax=Actinokineospora enzanensis TaxID=155975 RepID=UPI001B7FBA33|nr:alpha/beta hydrolase [Actinokineospora enzanensis]